MTLRNGKACLNCLSSPRRVEDRVIHLFETRLLDVDVGMDCHGNPSIEFQSDDCVYSASSNEARAIAIAVGEAGLPEAAKGIWKAADQLDLLNNCDTGSVQ